MYMYICINTCTSIYIYIWNILSPKWHKMFSFVLSLVILYIF